LQFSNGIFVRLRFFLQLTFSLLTLSVDYFCVALEAVAVIILLRDVGERT